MYVQYVCMYVCISVCACVCERERERECVYTYIYDSANLTCAECLLFKGDVAPFYDCDFPFQLRRVT